MASLASSVVCENISIKYSSSLCNINSYLIYYNRSSNIGVPVHKGSPPSHLEGSPSSLGSNSSITSSTSGNSLVVQNPSTSYPPVKYYDNHLDRSSTLLGGRSDLRGEDGVTIGFNSTVPMATSSSMQTTIMAQAEVSELVSLNMIIINDNLNIHVRRIVV